MDCESCGEYARYKDFCGHWLCDQCAEADDAAAERAEAQAARDNY